MYEALNRGLEWTGTTNEMGEDVACAEIVCEGKRLFLILRIRTHGL